MAPASVLLVEGKDEIFLLSNLLDYYGIPETFKMIDKKGIDPLIESIELEIDVSDRQHIGIVVDADDKLASRWQSILGKLYRFDQKLLPKQPNPFGTIIRQEDLPIIGIWLMPNNTLPGMLEDFVQFLVPHDDVLLERAKEVVSHLPERRFIAQHQAKAEIHTWLAWQEEPGRPFGQAITNRSLNPNSPIAQQFIKWIRLLFDLPEPS